MRKDKTMDLVVISIFAAPFICTGMAFLMQIAEKKIKAVLAVKAKTAEHHRCKIEKLSYIESDNRTAV